MFAGDDLSVLGRAEQGEEAGLASQGRRALGRGRGGMWPSEARAPPRHRKAQQTKGHSRSTDEGPHLLGFPPSCGPHDKPASIRISQTGSEPGGPATPTFLNLALELPPCPPHLPQG